LNPESAGVLHVGGLDNFREVFGADTPFFKDKPWYVASFEGGAESAQIFEAGGYRFLHIALSFNPPTRSLAWAATIVRKYPGLPTLVTTHECLLPKGKMESVVAVEVAKVDPEDNNPQMVWDRFLSQHDQIFLVLCGHNPGQAHRTDPNESGHQVHQIRADYQDRHQTAKEAGQKIEPRDGIGDGWLRLLKFDMAAATPVIAVKTYSTHYKKFSGELPEYASWYREHEQPNMTDAEFLAAEDFKLELTDFRERFDKTGKAAH
jgi:hypothetical protein